MVVEMRIYTFKPGKRERWIELYRRETLPVKQRYLGRFLGFFTNDGADGEQAVLLWGFDSDADLQERRHTLEATEDWARLKAKGRELDAFSKQEVRVLTPAEFSPMR